MAEYSLFTETPSLAANADSAVSLGTEFWVTADCWVTGLRYLQPTSGSTGARTMAIYKTDGTAIVGPHTMPTPTAGTWCTYTLGTPVFLPVGHYRTTTYHPNGDYPYRGGDFGEGKFDIFIGPVTLPVTFDADDLAQGQYSYGGSIARPTITANGGNFWSDLVFTDTDPTGSSQDEEASIDYSGSGTLTGAGTPAFTAGPALSGSGTLTGSGAPAFTAGPALSGNGVLTGAGTPAIGATAALSGAGALSANSTPSILVTGALTGAGSLTGAAATSHDVTALLSGSGTLTGTSTAARTAAFTQTSTGTLGLGAVMKYKTSIPFDCEGELTFELSGNFAVDGGLSGVGTLSSPVKVGFTAVANTAGSGTLTLTARPGYIRIGALDGTGTLTGTVTPPERDAIVTAVLAPRTQRLGALPNNRWEAHL